MSLEKWVEFAWLRKEPSSPNEIQGLVSILERSLNDAQVRAISDDLRFQAAFAGALSAANLALRASGYRTRVQTGHHQKILESLELTIQADPRLIQKLLLFSKKRNATSYDSAGSISQQDLLNVIKVADELGKSVMAWMREHHSELM
jgi:hypothetical protein